MTLLWTGPCTRLMSSVHLCSILTELMLLHACSWPLRTGPGANSSPLKASQSWFLHAFKVVMCCLTPSHSARLQHTQCGHTQPPPPPWRMYPGMTSARQRPGISCILSPPPLRHRPGSGRRCGHGPCCPADGNTSDILAPSSSIITAFCLPMFGII